MMDVNRYAHQHSEVANWISNPSNQKFKNKDMLARIGYMFINE
jgi:hypothetical protein